MDICDNYWDKRIENAKSFEGELEDIPEDKEYVETMSLYVNGLHKIKCDLELLITELAGNGKMKKEVGKLNDVLTKINKLYND